MPPWITRLLPRSLISRVFSLYALSLFGFVDYDIIRRTLERALHDSDFSSAAFIDLKGGRVLADNRESTAIDAPRWLHRIVRPPPERHQPADRRAAKMTMTLERPTRRTLEVSIRDGDGQAISRIVHMRDVTHASEVDQMKSEFLSAAAHELRTPMTSIFGFVELMLTRQMTPERQKDVLETVYRQSKLMIAIINELLDLARIEARRGKDFVIESVDLVELIHRVVDDFRPPAGRRPPLLRIEGAARVRADRSKLIRRCRTSCPTPTSIRPAAAMSRCRCCTVLMAKANNGALPCGITALA